jgi:hypothetical protein
LNNTSNQKIQKMPLMLNIGYNSTHIKITGTGNQMRKIIQAIIEYRQRQTDLYLRCLTGVI